MTTRDKIHDWLKDGVDEGATHVIVVCDEFDGSDYPVFIPAGTDPTSYRPGKMQSVMECYALHLPLEAQLDEYRASHYELPPPPKHQSTDVDTQPSPVQPAVGQHYYCGTCGLAYLADGTIGGQPSCLNLHPKCVAFGSLEDAAKRREDYACPGCKRGWACHSGPTLVIPPTVDPVYDSHIKFCKGCAWCAVKG